MRLNLFVKEKELKSEKQNAVREVQTAKTLYEEANERPAQAIQNKNFSEAAVAKGFLKLQKRRWKMQWTKANSVQIRELNWKRVLQTCVYQEEKGQSLNVKDLLL